MNFDFSSEQQLLREQVARLLAKRCSLRHTREVLDGKQPYCREGYAALLELGVAKAAIDERFEGLGLGHLELCVTAEELGRVLAPVPFSSSVYLVAELLNLAGTDAQKLRYLPIITDGSVIATAALFSSGQSAPLRYEDGRVSGECIPVPDGMSAAVAVLLAEDKVGNDSAFTAVLVHLDSAGVSRETVRTVDPTRPHAKLTLQEVSCDIVGKRGDGTELRDSVYDRAAILFAFEQLGGAEGALEMACNYARERRTFGRQIGSYQAIKHKLSEIYARIHIARAHAYYGAWALSNNAPDLRLAAAGARISATQAFVHAAQENIQVHGGIGFTWEADCHLFYRRARLLALNLGNTLSWQSRLFKQLNAPTSVEWMAAK